MQQQLASNDLSSFNQFQDPNFASMQDYLIRDSQMQNFNQMLYLQLFNLLTNRLDPDLLKKSEELFNQTTDSQRMKFYQEMDMLIKNNNFDLQQTQPSKGEIMIQNYQQIPASAASITDYNLQQFYQSNGNNNQIIPPENPHNITTNSHCNIFASLIIYLLASLYNDSKFVPFTNQIPSYSPFDMGINAQSFINSQFNPSLGVSPNDILLQIQTQQKPLLNNQQKDDQTGIIQQYEQVMQMLHQEMQKLVQQNKDLTQRIQENQIMGGGRDQALVHLAQMIKEKDDLLDTLRSREHALNVLRQENDQLSNRVIELETRGMTSTQTNLNSKNEHQLKFQNEQLLDRVRKLENELRMQEQQSFDLESMNKNLKRDLKHQTMVNDQIQQEVQDINQKRDQLDSNVQDLKSKLAQSYLQQRQLNILIESQQIELTNLANQKLHSQKEEEQTHFLNEKLKEQLNELESQKLGQFQGLQLKDREIQNLRAILRRLLTVIQTHREQFGDLANVNYDGLFREVSNMNLTYQLPQQTFQHLSKSQSRVNNYEPDLSQQVRHKKVQNENIKSDDDYYGMVDRLTNKIRDKAQTTNTSNSNSNSNSQQPAPTSHYSSMQKQQLSRHNSSLTQNYQSQNQFQETNNSFDNRPIKSAYNKNIQVSQNDRKASDEQPKGVSWLSSNGGPPQQPNNPVLSNRDEMPLPASKSQVQPSQRQQNKSPEKKVPNIDGLKMTLSALQEEKKTLESQLRNGSSHKTQDDIKFDLEVLQKNIKTVQEKLSNAVQP